MYGTETACDPGELVLALYERGRPPEWLQRVHASRLGQKGLVPAQYLIVTPGGYLWHREFAARPQPLRIAPVEAAQCD